MRNVAIWAQHSRYKMEGGCKIYFLEISSLEITSKLTPTLSDLMIRLMIIKNWLVSGFFLLNTYFAYEAYFHLKT